MLSGAMQAGLAQQTGKQPEIEARRTHIVHENDGFRYFSADKDFAPSFEPPSTPLRVVIATSIRDIGGDDGCGRLLTIQGSDGPVQSYMKGAIEALLEATHGEFGRYVNIAGIIVDDVKQKDRVEEMGYAILPEEDGNWIMPGNHVSPCGRQVHELVSHHPSSWRKLPRKLEDERASQKSAYEKRVEQHCLDVGADIILSDHLLFRLEHLHQGPYKGRVLNIHPGITYAGDPDICRGLHPTQDAIDRAVMYGAPTLHGASLHFIADEIDGGAVICDAKRTLVLPHYDRPTLRYNNYESSKVPVLIEGLRYFASHLDHFDQHFRA